MVVRKVSRQREALRKDCIAITKTVKVTPKIYDTLGTEIETIINDQMEPDYYKYHWNAFGNASGIYFYRLTAGNFVSTKKLILLK